MLYFFIKNPNKVHNKQICELQMLVINRFKLAANIASQTVAYMSNRIIYMEVFNKKDKLKDV